MSGQDETPVGSGLPCAEERVLDGFPTRQTRGTHGGSAAGAELSEPPSRRMDTPPTSVTQGHLNRWRDKRRFGIARPGPIQKSR